MVSHQVPYGTEGTQNNVKVSWTGPRTSGGSQILVWATRVRRGCPQATTSRTRGRSHGGCTRRGEDSRQSGLSMQRTFNLLEQLTGPGGTRWRWPPPSLPRERRQRG